MSLSLSPRPLSWRPLAAAVSAAALALLVAVVVHAGAPAAQPPSAAPAKLAPALQSLATAHPGRSVEAIVQFRAGTDRRAATAAVRAAGARVSRELALIHGVVARMPARSATILARRADVRAVSLNAAVESSGTVDPATLRTSYNQSIRADRSWAAGATGKGIGVAVIDTGIAGNLPDFRVSQSDTSTRVVAHAVVNPAAQNGRDTYGHGTHVAGLIAGNGTNRDAGDPAQGRYAGAAPDANLIAIKADDGNGNTTLADVVAGLQFVVDFRKTYNIRVVNLSLRSSVAESYKTDPLDAAVEQAWFAGVVVVAAAGNAGAGEDAVKYSPGNDPFAITVGAVDDQGTKDISDDRLATWSGRGTTQDGFEKPDVVAPGAHLTSTLAPSSYYASACPACVVDDGYLRIGGTSMAAAVISGEVADLLQMYPAWGPEQVRAAVAKRTRAVISPTSATLVDAAGEPAGTTSVTDTVVGAEAAVDKAELNPTSASPTAVAPSTWLDPTTLAMDYQRLSWTRLSWTEAPEGLRPVWSRLSWTSAEWARLSWTATPQSCSDFSRADWTRLSWTDADLAWAKDQCAAMDPTAAYVTPTSAEFNRVSWSTSFDR